jgi:hypothetical protein
VRPIKNNDVLSGRIESRGIHDLYTFDGHIGDVVRVCDISSPALGFLLPNGSDTLGLSCRAGSDSRLTQDGPYKLVVNAADGGPGECHFVFQIVSTNAGVTCYSPRGTLQRRVMAKSVQPMAQQKANDDPTTRSPGPKRAPCSMPAAVAKKAATTNEPTESASATRGWRIRVPALAVTAPAPTSDAAATQM